MHAFFASCPRGLEPLLLEDIQNAKGEAAKAISGGVSFYGTQEVCYRLNLQSRIATRILWQISSGKYLKEDDIYRLAYNTPWADYFEVSKTLRVEVIAIKSPLKSLEFITLRIKDAICDRFRKDKHDRPSIDTKAPDVRVHAFLTQEDVVLYLDTSGTPLYQRGFRQKTVEAPLKENLAAGILRLSGWMPGTPLLDPMCGSGTFLIEAAQMVLGIAPGLQRSFGFENLKNFDESLWVQLKDHAKNEVKPIVFSSIYGRDISPIAARASLANLDRAGLLPAVKLKTCDLLQNEAPEASGILIANPPYGERLSEQEEMAAFYPALGTALKQHYPGWFCHFLTADLRMPKLMRLSPARKTPLFNGALECRLFAFEMVAGSHRKPKKEAV